MPKVIKSYLLVFLLIICFEQSALSQNQQMKFGFEINDQKRSVSIPFKLINNLMVVDVLFQGVVPLKFIIDTGVTNTVLIEKIYADVLDIEPDRKMTLVGAAGGKEVEAFIVNSVNINLKGITGTHIPLLVLADDYLKLEESMGIKVHGILGYDLFKNFIVKIDYPNRTITFFNHKSFNKKLWWYRSIPLKVENTKPYIFQQVKLKDSTTIKAKLMIDTGASHSLMLHQNRDSSINIPLKNIRDILGAGIAGSIEGHVGRIDHMNILDYQLEEVIARFPDKGSYSEVIENTGRHGTLGGGVLRRFNIYLNYRDEVLYLKKNKYFKEAFDYDMSGLSIIAKGELFLRPYYEVEEVRENTPASNAGVKEKDVIISLNGYMGEDLDLSRINDILTSKEGRKIRLKVRRNEEILLFEFRLEKFI
ncbi:aspartyl protease family protein [Marivirga atlantica]|jgi:predicted aspartyl protease|uniref:Aspartyl protease family protein n=1 Tax=Marivirga atlantica TaxID=1548457 RepID=A0A937DJ35_9BACT|nr:aspartyl protease family protein [Marivirga atlantica]MBL0764464.1 aspartyl protease family protein [Marivirga atlantica]